MDAMMNSSGLNNTHSSSDMRNDRNQTVTSVRSLHQLNESMRSFGGNPFDTSVVKRIAREDIRLIYLIETVLGTGRFGAVRLAHKPGNPDKKFAVKSIPREKVEAELALLE